MYRFLGRVNQLDRGFEGLARAQQSIEPTEKTPADCFQASKFKLEVGKVPPSSTGKAGSIGDGRWIAQNC
ncbi:hypothetical protein D0A37_01350 [Microcoleus vaginatus HSN003]|nr:hypothetical protein D0A37_01350 [Microcoleus vaginatus HSN003]